MTAASAASSSSSGGGGGGRVRFDEFWVWMANNGMK